VSLSHLLIILVVLVVLAAKPTGRAGWHMGCCARGPGSIGRLLDFRTTGRATPRKSRVAWPLGIRRPFEIGAEADQDRPGQSVSGTYTLLPLSSLAWSCNSFQSDLLFLFPSTDTSAAHSKPHQHVVQAFPPRLCERRAGPDRRCPVPHPGFELVSKSIKLERTLVSSHPWRAPRVSGQRAECDHSCTIERGLSSSRQRDADSLGRQRGSAYCSAAIPRPERHLPVLGHYQPEHFRPDSPDQPALHKRHWRPGCRC
jgi:hypothetical protein